MEAIILAGGTPAPGHPLHRYTRGKPRAMLEVAGKPMIQWVLNALHETRQVDHIVLIGLDTSYTIGLETKIPLTVLADQGSLLENARSALLSLNNPHELALMLSSDIPALRGKMIDWAIETARKHDKEACYFVVRREVMESRFPIAHRTFVRLRDVEVCGADLVVVKPALARSSAAQWEKLIAARKNPFKQAAILGLDLMLGLLLRRFTLQEVAQRVAERVGVDACVGLAPYAEMAMDADKPHQIEALRQALLNRQLIYA